MKAFSATTISFMLFATKAASLSVVAQGSRAPGPALPYPIGDMNWSGSVAGGPELKVNGTMENVISYLNTTQPKFDLEALTAAADAKTAANVTIVARTPWWIDCNPPVPRAYWSAGDFHSIPIEDAIRHLKSVGGYCGCAPHTCCRVSCSWSAAAFICNDNDHYVNPVCEYLGNTMVQTIANQCMVEVRQNGGWGRGVDLMVRGKIWDTENYSVTWQGFNEWTC